MTDIATRGSIAGHWVTIICAVLSLAGAIVTGVLSYRAQTAPTNLEMTKLALSMLEDPGTPAGLRDWAINILGAYTSVPISPSRREELARVAKDAGGIDLSGGNVAPVNPDPENPEIKDLVHRATEFSAISKALNARKSLGF